MSERREDQETRREELTGNLRDPAQFLARVDALRDSIQVEPITDEFLARAKNDGRP